MTDPFLLLFYNHPLPMFVYDLETLAFLEVNEAAIEKYGYSREEFQGLTIKDIRPAEDIDRLVANLAQKRPALQHSGAWQHRLKNGTLIDVEITSHTLEFEGHKAALVMAQDITERKLAEEALRESEERYRQLFENSPIGIYRTTPDGHILASNPALIRMLGFSRFEQLSQRNLERGEADATYSRKIFKEQLEREGRITGLEAEWRRRDNTPIFVRENTQVIRDETGATLYYEGTVEDITERKQAEEKIERRNRELEALNATILDIASPHPLPELLHIIVERACTLLNTTNGGLYLCDEARQEVRCVVSYNTSRVFTGTILKYGEGAAGYVAQTGEPLMIDDYRIWPGRAKVYASVQEFERMLSVPMKWEGRMIGVIHALRARENLFNEDDLELLTVFANHAALAVEQARLYETLERELKERIQVEEKIAKYSEHLEEVVAARTRELREAQEQLVRQEKLAVLGQLAGGVGHELRNPLAVINNAIYFLKLVQPNASEKVKEYLGIIQQEVRTAEKIITDLLDFSRIKSVARERVFVAPLVQQTLARYPVPPPVQVTLDFPADLPQVFADPRQITQVLGNLIVNACQAMSEGGELVIRGECSASADAYIRADGDIHREKTFVAVRVQDSGIGIPPENMQKLFEPLFTTKLKGIGLGLAVSQKLVEANGGKIEVQSEVGVGSKFTVYLPVMSPD